MVNITLLFLSLFILGLLILFFSALGYILFNIFRLRDRETRSLDSTLLEISVNRDNEIKIDAMEQVFSTLSSLKKGGWRQRFSTQPTISFEIIAQKEDIRFYVWTPNKYKDLIERQLNGAYPDAQIRAVDEINIFTPDSKVAYKDYQLKKNNFYPLKTFRELSTDPLSAIT